MNPQFANFLRGSLPYGSHFGITGIQAVFSGSDAFSAWVARREGEIGTTANHSWFAASGDLPTYGIARFGRIGCVFFSGASTFRHGNAVIQGAADAGAYPGGNGYNRVARLAIEGEFTTWAAALSASVDELFIYGHSYGGVCAQVLGDLAGRINPTLITLVETYGAPRSVYLPHYGRPNITFNVRNVHSQDVVSHIPYHSVEAPLASSLATADMRRIMNAMGHPVGARVYEMDGDWDERPNNVMAVQDTTLTMLAWVTYSQHITSRVHELATYVNTMTAAALASPFGRLPPASIAMPQPPVPPAIAAVPQPMPTGNPPNLPMMNEDMQEDEEAAAAEWLRRDTGLPARGVRYHGVAGVDFRGGIRVRASGIRSARNLAKRLNKLRRILGPVTTEQRAELLAALDADFIGQM